MTANETSAILRVLRGAYPNWSANEDTFTAWAAMFTEDDAKDVAAAVKAYIASDQSGYAPTIGKIRGIMAQNSIPNMSEGEAWKEIRKAISNGLYGACEEFQRLPPILQRIVGSPDQLTQWAMVTNGLDTVVASTVKRDYLRVLEQERTAALIPKNIQNALPAGGVQALTHSMLQTSTTEGIQ